MTQSTSSRNAAKEPVIKNLLPYHAESAKETKTGILLHNMILILTDEYDESDDYLIILRRILLTPT